MALRRVLGLSDGELMRANAKPCSRLMDHTAIVFTFGGAMSKNLKIVLKAACGALTMSSSTALLVRLLSCQCETSEYSCF
ncbi:hypothetical protein MKX03_009106 [Papaver bracteatum]|nr:hypothetical protein MKX03_009106 [Papaver bracteatum]